MSYPALALLEFGSIAVGLSAGDAMVKRSPVATIQAGTVQPGHYLVMVTGSVAEVEEAVTAGREIGQLALLDTVYLPDVHPDVSQAIGGYHRPVAPQSALGIIETHTVASAIAAADAGRKGAEVNLVQLRLADGLQGKGLVLFSGLVADVQAAMEIGLSRAANVLVHQLIIPQLHPEMGQTLSPSGRFSDWQAT